MPKVDGPEDVAGAHMLPRGRAALPDRVGGRRSRPRTRSRSTAGVAGVSLGEADLRSETGALEAGLDWARGRIVNAAVAAGLPRPPQSVYPHVRDAEGLARSCAPRPRARPPRPRGDPSRPAAGDRAGVPADGARRSSAPAQRSTGSSRRQQSATLGDGEFVDAAMLGAARQIVALAESYGTA